eukprot:Phypoly_transcript_08004.p1 GENE.Phypoly_transcript_08004~~Phypoly_transcript_08004.p1  ORF type:complete len:352 (+),score=61.67 Phypoly_transcript_08004:481-1536(+)
MSVKVNKVVLAKYMEGAPKAENFAVLQEEINPADLPDGQVYIQILYLGMDPGNRMRMSAGYTSFAASFPLNQPPTGSGIAKVIKSKNPKFADGDIIAGFGFPWAEFAFLAQAPFIYKISPDPSIPLSYYLNTIGHVGLTAYVGLLDVCDPKQGETVLVSSAGGAVGYIVGQLAKIRGCKVIGIAGSEKKLQFLHESKFFDELVNYKTSPDLKESIAQAARKLNPGAAEPEIDVYFDNVGGETLDIVLSLLKLNARVSICGQLSQYNNTGEAYGIKNMSQVLTKQVTIKGFIMLYYAARFPAAISDLEKWVKEKKLKNVEDVATGIQSVAEAFIGMISGDNIGRRIVKISDV